MAGIVNNNCLLSIYYMLSTVQIVPIISLLYREGGIKECDFSKGTQLVSVVACLQTWLFLL